ncbi:MAG: YwaF family protein [Clostridia bacterium]|nr:YwaF family protein [Clostridia bacterium]
MAFLTAEAQLFDLGHSLYMVISFALMALFLLLSYKLAKTQAQKDRLLRMWAIITVAIHYSVIYVNFLLDGDKAIGENMIFAIHPCNVCMWLLLIVSLVKKRDTLAFRILAEFVAWGGTVCGIIGIVLNENYVGNGLGDYEAFKGLVSHSTMIAGALYLLVVGYIKIRVFNVISVASGLAFFLINGAFINTLYGIFDRGEPNSMYLQEPPFPDFPWINTLFIGVVAVLVCFTVTAVYEQLALKKEDRWYTRLKQIIRSESKC